MSQYDRIDRITESIMRIMLGAGIGAVLIVLYGIIVIAGGY